MIAILMCEGQELLQRMSGITILNKDVMKALTVYRIQKDDSIFLMAFSCYGKVNIGMALGILTYAYKADAILGAGNCASLHQQNININDMAISTRSLQYDVNYCGLGFRENQIPGLKNASYETNQMLREVAFKCLEKRGYIGHSGMFISADQFVANNYLLRKIKCKYEAGFLDNECGAMGSGAEILGIPFVGIKGVSNYANDQASMDYNMNHEMANEMSMLVAMDVAVEMKSCCTSGCKWDWHQYTELTKDQCLESMKDSDYARLGVIDGDQPYIVPMCFRNIENGEILMESMSLGKKIQCLENNMKVAVEFESKCDQCLMSILVEGTAKLVQPEDVNREDKFIIITMDRVTGRAFARS